MLLALLHLDAAVLGNTAVQLDSALVRLHAHLNACTWSHQSENLQASISGSRVWWSVGDESVVDTSAAGATVPNGVWNVLADCSLCLGEVEAGTLSELNFTIWNEDSVSANATFSVGHVESVVQDCHGIVVDESAEVPVDVVGEHDWSGLVERDGNESRDPRRTVTVGCESVGRNVQQIAGETLLCGIVVGEGDAGCGVSNHSP